MTLKTSMSGGHLHRIHGIQSDTQSPNASYQQHQRSIRGEMQSTEKCIHRSLSLSINQPINFCCINSCFILPFVDGIDICIISFCVSLSFALISSRRLGASRGFAFVEFNTEEEATRWMEYKQVSGVKQETKQTSRLSTYE